MNKTIKAVILRTDGTNKIIELADTLEALQKAVGGHIQIVHCGADGYEDCLLIIDEEGKLKDLPINVEASILFGVPSSIDYIVGTAILCGTDKLGDIGSLAREVLREYGHEMGGYKDL